VFGYAIRRTVSSLVTIVLVSIVVFALVHLIPGNPAQVILGFRSTPYQLGQLRVTLGLNKPLPVQYANFWSGVVHGTMGMSLIYRQPVLGLVFPRLAITLFLVIYSAVLSVIAGVPIGTIAALKKEKPTDQAIRVMLLIGVAVPAFWIGTLLILVFSLKIPIFPVAGYGSGFAGHMVSLFLPALTLALWQTALIARNLRTSILEVIRMPYVDFARMKGLPPWSVLRRHILRNGLVSTVTIVGINVSFLLAGAVVVESVFSIPGSGSLLVQSVFARDYPVIEGITFVYAVLVILINLITDLIYPLLDPRVRLT
jgi:peptide/nickel transport system permease protein